MTLRGQRIGKYKAGSLPDEAPKTESNNSAPATFGGPKHLVNPLCLDSNSGKADPQCPAGIAHSRQGLLSGKTILPTRTCFDDALQYLEYVAAELLSRDGRTEEVRSELLKYTLVHAICLHPEENHPFAHAWIEHDGEAIECGIMEGARITYATQIEEHNAKLRVQECTKYTMPEIVEQNYKSGHTGPWIERYAALCAENLTPETKSS